MKELSIQIRLLPANASSPAEVSLLADQVSLQPSLESNDYGTIFNLDNDIIVERPSSETISQFSIERSVIVEIRDTDGKVYEIGTKDIPARVLIAPYLNRAILKITCKMLSSPFK